MKKWFALTGLMAAALVAAPAYADMTIKSQDGGLELALPNGWHEGKAQGRLARLVAVDGKGSRLVVRFVPKEDFKDPAGVVKFTVSRLKLSDNDGVKTEDIQIAGKPAMRATVMGTEATGMRAGFVITVFEYDGNYVEVTASADASGFAKESQLLNGFAGQLKFAATNAPAMPAATTPAATTPAATTPVKPLLPKP